MKLANYDIKKNLELLQSNTPRRRRRSYNRLKLELDKMGKTCKTKYNLSRDSSVQQTYRSQHTRILDPYEPRNDHTGRGRRHPSYTNQSEETQIFGARTPCLSLAVVGVTRAR